MYEFCYPVNTAVSLHSLGTSKIVHCCGGFLDQKKKSKRILLHFQNDQSSQPVLIFGKNLKWQSILTLPFLRRNIRAPTLTSMLKNSPSCCRGKVAPPHCCPLRLDHLRTWPPSLSYSDTIKT